MPVYGCKGNNKIVINIQATNKQQIKHLLNFSDEYLKEFCKIYPACASPVVDVNLNKTEKSYNSFKDRGV